MSHFSPSHQAAAARGRWGEQQAERYLRNLGYRIVDRNWRSGEKHVRGDIDIICRDGATLVFCEVKTRQRSGHGGAIGAISPTKQAAIRRLAASWLRTNQPSTHTGVRFDAVTIEGVRLTHWRRAFDG